MEWVPFPSRKREPASPVPGVLSPCPARPPATHVKLAFHRLEVVEMSDGVFSFGEQNQGEQTKMLLLHVPFYE